MTFRGSQMIPAGHNLMKVFARETLLLPVTCCCSNQQKRFAGHSKWANIKFKKMHKDNARAKLFGQLSREIIQSVKEKGSDSAYNPKLEALILKAKSSSMPKDKIETSIKNALRNSDEKNTQSLYQARGPLKCGLMIDVLTPNVVRTKHEIKGILKKNEATFITDGSVAFMFDHKGVVTVKDTFSAVTEDEDEVFDKLEEIAIEIGAESVHFNYNFPLDKKVVQFLCMPLEVHTLRKAIEKDFIQLEMLSADVQYLPNTLIEMDENNIQQADRLIDIINAHPDVLNVYDNIKGYGSSTIKLDDDLS